MENTNFWNGFVKRAGVIAPLVGAAGMGGLSYALSKTPMHQDKIHTMYEREARRKGLKEGSKEFKEFVSKKVKMNTAIGTLTSAGIGGMMGHAIGGIGVTHKKIKNKLPSHIKETPIESVVKINGKKYFINPKAGNA